MSIQNALQVFSYQDSEVRTVLKDGEPWFVALDLCGILNTDATQTRKLDDDEKGLHSIQTLGGMQQMTVVNESGLFSLILTSRKPEAKRFKKWVTSEVLPTIRKTGKYEVQSFTIPTNFHEALQLAADQAKQLADQKPLVEFAQNVNTSSNSMDLGNFAKILGTGRTRLFRWLKDNGFLMESGKPYQQYVDNEYFVVIETTFNRGDEIHTYAKPQITGKGQLAIERKFNQRLAA
jgi:anti-repressor protein